MAAAASLFPDEMDEHDVGRLQVSLEALGLPLCVHAVEILGQSYYWTTEYNTGIDYYCNA